MPSRRFISTRTAASANGAPESPGYVYRGKDREPADPVAASDRSRRDAAKRAAGLVLRAAREAAGLSQPQAAQAAGCSAGYISAVENGHDWPSKRLIAALAAAYGVSPQDLAAAAESAPVALSTPDEARPVPRAGRATRPVAAVPDPSAATGPMTPGTAVEAAGNSPPRAVPGTSAGAGDGEGASPALRGEAWRKAAQAELSSQHAAQRRGRVRRAPKPITGIVKPPPDGAR